MASSTPRNYRATMWFGIEFEFLVDCKLDDVVPDASPQSDEDLLPMKPRYWVMAKGLHRYGLPAACIASELGDIYVLEPDLADHDFFDDDDTLPQYRYWFVQTDQSVKAMTNDPDTWQAVEISSPIMDETEWRHGFPTITRAIGAIRDAADGNVHLNKTTGLHVHLGLAQGLDCLDAKRLMTLFTLMERLALYEFVAPSRVYACNPIHDNLGPQAYAGNSISWLFSRSPTQEMRDNLPEEITHDMRERNLPHMLQSFWKPATMQALESVVPRSSGFAIKQHTDVDHGTNWTFEVRYAQSSLLDPFVRQWVHLVLALHRASQLSPAAYRVLVSRLYEIYVDMDDADDDAAAHPSWHRSLQALQDALILTGEPIFFDFAFWRNRAQRVKDGLWYDVDENGIAIFRS